jgi:hypothetical protein
VSYVHGICGIRVSDHAKLPRRGIVINQKLKLASINQTRCVRNFGWEKSFEKKFDFPSDRGCQTLALLLLEFFLPKNVRKSLLKLL